MTFGVAFGRVVACTERRLGRRGPSLGDTATFGVLYRSARRGFHPGSTTSATGGPT
jgi:hypothetical protein